MLYLVVVVSGLYLVGIDLGTRPTSLLTLLCQKISVMVRLYGPSDFSGLGQSIVIYSSFLTDIGQQMEMDGLIERNGA